MGKYGKYSGLSRAKREMYEDIDEIRESAISDAKRVKPNERESGPCNCGGRFVLRQNSKNKEYFYGCSNYPRCTKTKPIDIPDIGF